VAQLRHGHKLNRPVAFLWADSGAFRASGRASWRALEKSR